MRFTRVVQAVDTLPAGQRRGLALPLQRSVVLQAAAAASTSTACSGALLLWTLLWGVVTGEGERRTRALQAHTSKHTSLRQRRLTALEI